MNSTSLPRPIILLGVVAAFCQFVRDVVYRDNPVEKCYHDKDQHTQRNVIKHRNLSKLLDDLTAMNSYP